MQTCKIKVSCLQTLVSNLEKAWRMRLKWIGARIPSTLYKTIFHWNIFPSIALASNVMLVKLVYESNERDDSCALLEHQGGPWGALSATYAAIFSTLMSYNSQNTTKSNLIQPNTTKIQPSNTDVFWEPKYNQMQPIWYKHLPLATPKEQYSQLWCHMKGWWVQFYHCNPGDNDNVPGNDGHLFNIHMLVNRASCYNQWFSPIVASRLKHKSQNLQILLPSTLEFLLLPRFLIVH